MSQETYEINLAGIRRHLPLVEVAPGLKIAVLNTLGDTELVEACAAALAEKLAEIPYDVLVTAESKSIPLTHSLAVKTGKPYVVCRKNYKTYMGKALDSTSNSITSQSEQHLILDAKDIELIRGKKVVIVDDVISTGSTMRAIRSLVELAGSDPDITLAAICTEGADDEWKDVISLGHLPLFKS